MRMYAWVPSIRTREDMDVDTGADSQQLGDPKQEEQDGGLKIVNSDIKHGIRKIALSFQEELARNRKLVAELNERIAAVKARFEPMKSIW